LQRCARRPGAAAQFTQQAKVPNLVLNHFSPRYHGAKERRPSLSNIEAESRTAHAGKLFLADDLDRSLPDKQGILSGPL
jgi:ribonuclease Z